jgi:ABC-type glycerol-3-phosphate transport system substrate-binding protein
LTRAASLRLVLWTLALSLLAGCSLFRSGAKETPAPPTPGGTLRPTPIGTPPGTSLPGTPSPIPTVGPVTLVLWTSEDYAPTSETEGGMQLLDQIQAFQQDHDVRVEVILKKRSGTGGLLDFLTTASKAAPSVLPDVITLSDADLYRATRAGLLQPLDDLVPPELLEDQFDFVTALTQLDGTTMGMLYQADLQHLVYDTTLVEEPPLSWRDLYSSTVPFVFSPVAPSDGVNNAILIQYLALGGELTDAAGQASLDSERLTAVLEFFSRARQAGVIPQAVLALTDVTAAWATYRIGEAGMVQVPASIFLAERAGLSNAGFGSLPLRTPGIATVGNGWALAIVTQDPQRQELAAALIEHLLAAENSGAWTQAAGRLPARYAALDAWAGDDPYLLFIRDLLTQAQPAVKPDLAAAVGGPLAEALADVLSGRATPAAAAEAAALAVGGAP